VFTLNQPVDELPSTAIETIFSSLKRIKTYLRSTMGENRLNGLELLNIHPEIIVEPEEVVNVYANKHPRRLQLL